MERVDYVDTFIAIAPDSPLKAPDVPGPRGGKPTVASATFEMLGARAYAHRSSDAIFTVWADRRDIPESDRAEARAAFYAKPQACLRASDLGKRYGWGVHADADGFVALYGIGSPDYETLAGGRSPVDGRPVKVTAAMRGRR